MSVRTQSQLSAEDFWLEILVDKEFDDTGGVLVDHDLAPETGLLVVGVDDAADLLDRVSDLQEIGKLPHEIYVCIEPHF